MPTINLSNFATDTIESKRAELLSALHERTEYEVNENAGLQTEKQLARFSERARKLDALTLASACNENFDFLTHYMSHRHGSDKFNIYAITKTWELLRVLAGSDFDESGNDGATLIGTISALNLGIANQTRIANALDEYMQHVRDSATYRSGNVQSSSSLRALEALGIVRKTGREGQCNLWGIADSSRFNVLLHAADLVPVAFAEHTDDNNTADDAEAVQETVSADAVQETARERANRRKREKRAAAKASA